MKISIVTPNYNYASFISQTIESVINQNYSDFEYIIIDDGSTDNSVEIIKSYVAKYPNNIFLIRQENKGQTPAINVGMKKVTGDIICWINSDDTFCPDVFKEVANCFKKNKSADIVFGDMNVVDMKGNFMNRKRHLDFNYTMGCLLGFTTILSSNTVFWKKDAMLKNGYFNETLKCNMDGDFYSRLTKGMIVKRINKALANFRKQPYTKAAENDSNWNSIVKKETKYERERAYNSLLMARVIPYKYSTIVKLPFQFARVFLRMLHLHYFKQKKELKSFSNRTK